MCVGFFLFFFYQHEACLQSAGEETPLDESNQKIMHLVLLNIMKKERFWI